MRLCWRRESGWRGVGDVGTWMMSDDHEGQQRHGFLVMALSGAGHMPAKGEDKQKVALVLYVAATRATQRLVVGMGGDGGLRGG